LRIAIDEQCINFGGGKGCRQVDGGRGLTDAALLVCDCDYASHRFIVFGIGGEYSKGRLKSMPVYGASWKMFHVEHTASKHGLRRTVG
jgi:hypothetical protein